MNKIRSILFLIFLSLIFMPVISYSFPFFDTPNLEKFATNAWLNRESEILLSHSDNINPTVLRFGLIAYMHARERGLDNKEMLTIIDYSKPSTERRLWVFDLKRNKEVYNTWVSHGKNSGGLMAHYFSNQPGSLASSIGVFVTDQTYFGDNGYSLRLSGLDYGYNNNAYERAIVIHGARYVNGDIARRYGEVGRSWGCPAVSQSVSHGLIDKIKSNTIVFAYYPDRHWLSHSQFLV